VALVNARCHELAALLRETLDAEIPAGVRVALLDYPNHENVGDSAIWLGEITYLAQRGVDVVYHCDLRSYDPRHVPDVDIVLLHGGGNLGDVWLPHQRFRERVLADFADRPILQLPQTIHFGERENLERTRRAFARHPRFTVLTRDARSLAFAREHFDCRSALCPDSAFALGPLARPTAPRVPILWLGRTDHEASGQAVARAGARDDVQVVDWIGRARAAPLDVLARAGGELAAATIGRRATLPPRAAQLLWSDWRWLARRRVTAGSALLSRGAVVVTDRLHGHILCLLLGIPHVALDNSYGKLSSFTTTWETLGPDARWAQTAEEALALARDAQPDA
jgi:pyruvyl transferase EpsO